MYPISRGKDCTQKINLQVSLSPRLEAIGELGLWLLSLSIEHQAEGKKSEQAYKKNETSDMLTLLIAQGPFLSNFF